MKLVCMIMQNLRLRTGEFKCGSARMISKSDYMLFLRQPAWLWLKKNEPSKLPPVDAATQAMFDAGHAFEPYVESLFPEGVTLGFNDFDEYRSLPLRI